MIIDIYTKIFYTPKNFDFNVTTRRKYRNVISTANCDAGIIISGRWGTMNEFTNLMDMGKVIGILTDTGDMADELKTLCAKCDKKTNSTVIFSSKPEELVKKIIVELKKSKI
jgi:hypothetical protein